jgi:hypothetical protein
MMIRSTDPHQAAIFASGLGTYPIEGVLIGFAVVVSILLLLVRAKRAHNQRLRKAASTGFYDSDVAHYGHSASATAPLSVPGIRSLAPTFVSSSRGNETKPKTAPVAPLHVPSAFVDVDRSVVDPLPEFDRPKGPQHRPQPPPPPPPPPSTSSLPLLEQPPPPAPDPRSD